MSDSETAEALRRAARRVAFHLLRAGVEGLKALEAVVDELGKVGDAPDRKRGDKERGPVHIDVE
ncbi:MAG TPA: hypothetical protein VHL52_14825 [Acidimicrobiia bacterium]|nr:hypothetical protein [Acidimicrobiia bacterium]